MSKVTVNKPLNSQERERDINRKLQVYGIYSAFTQRKLPSNKQIDVAMNSALGSKALATPSSKLSAEGREIVRDLRDVITNARNLVLVKNQGNLLQEFIWDAENFQRPDMQAPDRPFDKAGAKQDGQQVAEGLKTLGTLLVTNGEFRKLLNDATLLLRDMAGDSAQKAANFIRPPEDQLSQIDQAAPENVWHDKPDMSADAVKGRFGIKSKKDQNAAAAVDTTAQTNGAVQGNGTASGGQKSVEVTQEAKNRRREFTEKAKEFLAQKMPKERRDQTVWRLKKMIVEIQGHADYQQAIETLLTVAETYTGHAKGYSKQGTGSLKTARSESGLQSLEAKLQLLLERFANSTSMEDLFESINQFYRNAEKDSRLKEWFQAVDSFIRRCLQEQGFVLRDESNTEWNRLYDEGQYLMTERYRSDTNRLIGEFKFMGEQFEQDTLNKQFGDSMQKLFTDLGTDAQGKVAFKKHLMKDVTNVILPALFEHLHYIPIPRIEVSDPMVDLVVENLAIETDNLIPNILEFGSDNYWRWGRKKISNKNDNKILISATGIQTDLKDVSYYVRKKQGFPKLKDTGIMDIYLGGEGFSFKIVGSTTHKTDRQHFIKADTVKVTVKNLDVRLKKSKHKLLFSLFRPLLFKVMRPAIEKAIEKQIRDTFTKADAFAFDVHQEAQRTQKASQADPEDKQSMYNHYIAAAKKRMDKKKQEAEKKKQQAKERDTKVNVAMTKQDSIFPNISLPGGISTKATEYQQLAAKGERWETPVFSLGSATETTSLPPLAPITRKPHKIISKTREQEAAEKAARQPTQPVQHAQPAATYPPAATYAAPAAAAPTAGMAGTTGQNFAGRAAQATGAALNGPTTIPGTKAPII